MIKNFKLMSSTFLMAVTLTASQLSQAVETNFTDVPEEARSLVVKQAAYKRCLKEKNPVTLNITLGNLALVCKEWQTLINEEMTVNTPSWKAWYGVTPENEHIYQQFLNGVLIYRPNPQSDEGMIKLKISDLINPLEGTFDLSEFDDVSKIISISTGCRKGKKPEDNKKIEIYLAPRFMIEKKLKSTTKNFQPIMDNWTEETAPIGIFWSWGEWEKLNWYASLTTAKACDISSKNLYENWKRSHNKHEFPPSWTPTYKCLMKQGAGKISCSFVGYCT